jgi:hypothetical protein
MCPDLKDRLCSHTLDLIHYTHTWQISNMKKRILLPKTQLPICKMSISLFVIHRVIKDSIKYMNYLTLSKLSPKQILIIDICYYY